MALLAVVGLASIIELTQQSAQVSPFLQTN